MALSWSQIVPYLTIIGMEWSWTYLLLALLNDQTAGGQLNIFGFFTAYLLAFAVNLGLKELKWPRYIKITINSLLWAAVLLLTVRFELYGGAPWSDPAWLLGIPRAFGSLLISFHPELIVLIGTATLWWFGSRIARLKVNFSALITDFQFGLLVLVVLFFIGYMAKVPLNNTTIALLFFGCSLLGISIAHAKDGQSWLSGVSRQHWMILLLVLIGIILGAGLIIGLLINPDFVQILLNGVKWVWNLIIKIIEWFASLFPVPQPGNVPAPTTTVPSTGTGTIDNYFNMSETLRRILQIAWTALFIGLMVFALWRIAGWVFERMRGWMNPDKNVKIEPVHGAFLNDIINLLRRLFRIFHINFNRGMYTNKVAPEITSTRQIYRQLLHWAGTSGLPRRLAQTPDEYRQALSSWFPAGHAAFNSITEKYNAVRYGQEIPTESDLQELRRILYQIRREHKNNNLKTNSK